MQVHAVLAQTRELGAALGHVAVESRQTDLERPTLGPRPVGTARAQELRAVKLQKVQELINISRQLAVQAFHDRERKPFRDPHMAESRGLLAVPDADPRRNPLQAGALRPLIGGDLQAHHRGDQRAQARPEAIFVHPDQQHARTLPRGWTM